MKKILFVCLGNICRSPTAQAVFSVKLAQAGYQIEIDSAGIISNHQGNPPDARAIDHARSMGLDLSSQRARQIRIDDFHTFDRIFAMDRSNLTELKRHCPQGARAQIELVMNLVPDYGVDEVPDPYYGGDEGFKRVLDMLDCAADRLIAELQQQAR